jgi:hypothetical protein
MYYKRGELGLVIWRVVTMVEDIAVVSRFI